MSRQLMALLLVLVGGVVWAQNEVTVSEKTEAGQPTVVMENAFLRMAFSPSQGGECTDLVYKPTGKRLVMPQVGALLGNRVWNYADRELYMQWQKCAWDHKVLRKADEATLVLSANGQVGFTRSTTFEKRITLRAGEAMARVEHVFHVGQELMVPQKIGLWFYNRAGVVGEHTVYTFPLDDAIVTVDPAAGAGQEWFYNPSRGWAALTADGGDGLCFNMEFRRLMCFYLCPGKQPTFEWAFRTMDIKNGESFRTEELIVPFSGIKRVGGSGNGVVAGFDVSEKCSLADAQNGLSVKTAVASAATGECAIAVSCRRLPDGKEQAVHEGKLNLQPGKTASAEFVVKADQEGTWLLTGRVMRGGKELTDFMAPVIVGKECAPLRIAAKEERTGRPSERFEDKVALAGSAPKDIELSMAVESEHVKWAKPYCKGKTKVMVLTSCLAGREAVELAERMDMETIWVTAGTETELGYISGVFGRDVSYIPQHMNHYIKENLARPCDVVLIGGLRGDLFEDGVIELLRKKVEEGVGLVYVAPNRGPDKLYSFLPVEKETQLRRRNGQWRAAKQDSITVGIPFDALPRTDYTLYKAKTDPLATIEKDPLIVAQDGPGKGRVVVFSYNTGWQGSGNFECGITPWVEDQPQKFKYWECHLSMIIRSILWAAHKEPPVALNEIKVSEEGERQVVLGLANPGNEMSVSADVRVSNSFGDVVHERTEEAKIKAGESRLAFDLPGDLAAGLHLVDVILKNKENVVTWGTAAWTVDYGGLTFGEIVPDKRAYYPGDTINAKVELSTPGDGAEREVSMQAELTDSLGRLLGVEKKRFSVKGKREINLKFEIGEPLATHGTIRAGIAEQGKLLTFAQADVIMFPEPFAGREWGDWQSCIWGTPVGAYEREYLMPTYIKVFKEYGINTVLASANWRYDREYAAAVRAGFQIMPMSVAFGCINVGHRVPKGKMAFAEARTEYQKTHDKKCLVRPVCLNDPADLEPVAEKLREVAEYAGWLEPIGYNLGDEMSMTYYVTPFDYDFGPVCLNCFREWIKGQYGALEALNKEWDTTFESWDAVMPMTADEVKERKNYAPWADHREFMDITFAKFFAWVRERLREKDPRATVGMSGSQAAEAYGGYNWQRLMQTLDFVQNYTHQDTIIMQRSFDGRVPRAPWYGYKCVNPWMRYFLWWCFLNDNWGGSYFVDNYMFYPDMTPTQSTKDTAEVIREFQGGLAKLLRNTERVNDIGILYSQPSIRGAFISGADAFFRDNRHGWVQCLEDLGFQCEFIAAPDLAAGKLAEKNYPALVLPYAVALSEKEANALRKYVEDGGLLIADGKIGLMNEHCRTLDRALLDDLFGVSREKVDPLCSARQGEARFDRDMDRCALKGLSLEVDCPVPDLKLNGGEALGRHGDTPIAIVNKKGKGIAVLLNLFLDVYPRRRELKIEAPIKQLVSNLLLLKGVELDVRVSAKDDAGAHFFTVRYRQGETLYVATLLEAQRDEKDRSVAVDLAFPKKGFVFDVRKGEFLSEKDSLNVTLGAGDAAVYAVLPYRVKELLVKPEKESVRAGEGVRCGISIVTDGKEAGAHVVLVDVIGPDGKARLHYGAKLLAQSGRAKAGFPLAINDPAGEWTIRATDLVTRATGNAVFRVSSP